MFLSALSGRGSRPYPIDVERKTRVMVELAKRGMTITDLALHLNIDQGYLSKLISGRDLSDVNEEVIARFFHMPKDYLFPPRSGVEIMAMREAEEQRRGAA